MTPLAVFLLAQMPGLNDPNAVQKQAGLCISALGFEKPQENPNLVVRKKEMWVIAWGAFEIELASCGVLSKFRLVNHKYRLSKSTHYPGMSDQAKLKTYLTHACNAAGMLQQASSQKVFVSVMGKSTSLSSVYKPNEIDSIKLVLSGKREAGETTGLCEIQCLPIDGAISQYQLDRSEYSLETARVIGTFKLKK